MVVEASTNDGTTIPGRTGTFTIMSLPDIPVESYKAALTGDALTGNAGTRSTRATSSPVELPNFRATPVLGRASPDPNVGHYMRGALQGRRAHQHDRTKTSSTRCTWIATRSPDSQAGSAYFVVLLPCVVIDICSSLTHATHSFNKLTRPLTLISPSTVPRCRTTSPSPGTTTSTARAPAPTRTPSLPHRPGRGVELQRPDRVGPELRPERHHDQGRPGRRSPRSPTPTPRAPHGGGSRRSTGTATRWRGARRGRSSRSRRSRSSFCPLTGHRPGDYTLSWAAQPYAASYDLEVYKGGDHRETVNRVINASTDRVQYVLTNLDPSPAPTPGGCAATTARTGPATGVPTGPSTSSGRASP